MKPCLVVLLLLTACASTPEYERGTLTRPPSQAPSFRPELDAPHKVGQPGQQRTPGVSRSTDRRVLPPEERPGIWASDGDARRALILRMRRQLPGRVPDGITPALWKRCWEDVVSLMVDEPAAYFLTEAELECLRQRLLATCGEHWIGRLETAQKRRAEERGDVAFLQQWNGDVNYKDWEDAMIDRRRHRRCDGPGADTERVGGLYGSLANHGLATKGWPRLTDYLNRDEH